jgi:hypothetical protein
VNCASESTADRERRNIFLIENDKKNFVLSSQKSFSQTGTTYPRSIVGTKVRGRDDRGVEDHNVVAQLDNRSRRHITHITRARCEDCLMARRFSSCNHTDFEIGKQVTTKAVNHHAEKLATAARAPAARV